MLHVNLRNRITYPDLRLLYDTGMPCAHPTIKAELTSAIKKIRQKYNSANAKDPVEDKLSLYGNEGGKYVAWVKDEVKKLFNANKRPPEEALGQWRSIEFELIFKSKKDHEDFALLARQAGMGKFVTIKTDGSLRTEKDGEQANEVVLTYRVGSEQMVHDFCKLLRGRAYVNKTCGTHVHFDFRNVGMEEANLYGKRLARCVPALRLLLPAARRNSEYCKEIINNAANAAGGGNHGRYAFINMYSYAKYKTIEIRAHAGTINADKILNWIKLCEIIMATDLNFTGKPEHRNEVSTIANLLVQYADKLDDKMVEYVNSRFKTFSQTSTDEAEHTILAQEVATPVMFNPVAKKKPASVKKTKKKKPAAPAIPVVIPPAVNMAPEVQG